MTTAVTIAPSPILAFLDNNGRPCVGGSVLTQVGGVNTATYQDSAGTIPLPNPIPLNNRGEISNASGVSCQLFLATGATYVFTLFDANGNQLNQASYVTDSASSTIFAFAASLLSSIGSSLVGFIQAGIGAIARNLQDKGRERVSVMDFMTPAQIADVRAGTALIDVTAAFQAAADFLSKTTWNGSIAAMYGFGGGTIFVPPGRYLITSTVYLGQHTRVEGCSTMGYDYPTGANITGSQIVATFANLNSFVFESNTFTSTGTRVPFKDIVAGAQFDAGNYNYTHGIEVLSLYILCTNQIYGGIRLLGSPMSKINRVTVVGSSIYAMTSACYRGDFTENFGLTYLYGFLSLADNNAVTVGGWFDVIASAQTITSVNRPSSFSATDFGAGNGLNPAIYSYRCGLVCYFNNGFFGQAITTEHWDIGRIYINVLGLSENSMYTESCVQNSMALANVYGTINGLMDISTYTVGYLFGFNLNLMLHGVPAKPYTWNNDQFGVLNISCSKPDALGWSYADGINFIGAQTGFIRVSSGGAAGNIASDTTYTTIDEALRRIAASPIDKWVIQIINGQTVTIGAVHLLDGKNVTFQSDSTTVNANIVFGLTGNVPYYLNVTGNVSLKFENINLSLAAGTASNASLAGMITLFQGDAVNLQVTFESANIALQSSFYLFQQGFFTCGTITATFISCPITGSGTACLMGGASGSSAATNVIARQYNSTASASIKAIGTNGWTNANVISSNF